MTNKRLASFSRYGMAFMFVLAMSASYVTGAWAHCDTMDGPVVTEARTALETGTLTPVLKWVRPEDEAAVRRAFEQTLTVRKNGPEARDLADRYFFETVVRLHRASEGAPYTGLKPAGTDSDPTIQAADKAVEIGSPDALVQQLTQEIEAGLRQRYERVLETQAHAEESVEAGRAYVKAYVTFIHYAEHLHKRAVGADMPIESEHGSSNH